jgi:hypothetical protein
MSDLELAWFKQANGWALTINLPREVLEQLIREGAWDQDLEAEEGAGFPHVTMLRIAVLPEE